MLEQLKALVRVRLLLFVRTLTAGKAIGTVVAALILVGSFFASLGLSAGAFFLARSAVRQPFDLAVATAAGTLLFTGIWLWALLLELQRSDALDMRKLLYLPVSLRMVFVFNYAASLVTPATFFFVFPALGATLGAASRNLSMLLILLLAPAFYLMLTAWTYYFRGILGALMENRRRRRIVMAVVPMVFVLIFQAPNLARLAFERHRDNARESAETPAPTFFGPYAGPEAGEPSTPEEQDAAPETPEAPEPDTGGGEEESWRVRAIAGAVAIPLAWLPAGVYSLAAGRYGLAFLCFLGMAALGGAGLGLGYRSTLRHYTGAQKQRKAKRRRTAKPARERVTSRLVRMRFPLLDDDTSAAAGIALTGLLRYPQVWMAMVSQLVFGAVIVAALGMRRGVGVPEGLAALACIAWPHLAMLAFLMNVFGPDRSGFQLYVLLPTERRKFLVAKNLALFAVTGGVSLLLLLVAAAAGLLAAAPALTGAVLVVPYYLAIALVGNFASILSPFPLQMEGVRRQRSGGGQFLVLLGLLMLAPLTIPAAAVLMLDPLLALVGSGVPAVASPLAALGLAAAGVWAYRATVERQGRFMERRETDMRAKLAREDE